jgi:flagellar biosynthesis protein FlhF
MRDLAVQLARLEARMGAPLQMGLTTPPLADSLAIAGFSDKVISHLAPTVGTSDRAQAFAAALTKKLVAPNPLASLSRRLLVVIGASGVGKSTLAGKIAALTHATEPARKIALISATETQDFDRAPSAGHAQALAIEHGHLNANQLNIADFTTPDTTHILDSNLDAETLFRMLGPLRGQMAPDELVVILAIPAGASKARLGGEIKKYESLAPVLVFTKLDEYEISAQEVSQIAEDGMQIAMVSGTCDLNGTLAPVTDEMMNEFLMGLLAVQT